MSFTDAVKSVLSQYVGFGGRARRSEYWYFFLFYLIVDVVVMIVANVTGLSWLTSILTLALFLPNLAVSIRRLHDIGKSGWFVLLTLIPIVGIILLIVWYCKDSMPGENQYGPNPKGVM